MRIFLRLPRSVVSTIILFALCLLSSNLVAEPVATKSELSHIAKSHDDKHPRTDQFVSLFDGKSFAGWTGALENYEISQGILTSKKGVYGGLYTQAEYGDFEFRFEFRLTPGANNGIALRAPLEGDPAYLGFESQILDNTAEMYADLEPYQFHGSVYGIAPAQRGFLKPVGEWNEQSILCIGRTIKVTLNGKEIVRVNLDEVAPEGKTVDDKEHPGLRNKKGHLGLMSHDDRVDFRDLQIRVIKTNHQASAGSIEE